MVQEGRIWSYECLIRGELFVPRLLRFTIPKCLIIGGPEANLYLPCVLIDNTGAVLSTTRVPEMEV